MAAPPRSNAAHLAARPLPPLVTTQLIVSGLLQDVVGRDRVLEMLAHPQAPKPVLGGTGRGSTPIYGRDAAIAWFERIAAEGWPLEGAAA